MVKKQKTIDNKNPDRVETVQEIQLNNLARLEALEKRFEENEEKLSSTEEKLEMAEEKYKRILADYQNQERRHQAQESLIIKMASASLVEKLLLNIDSLELAQQHLQDKGLQMIIDQFLATFSGEGLRPIKVDHHTFDPLTMDCVEVVSGEKDKVVEILSPGYYLYDKVLRPAKVRVGSGEK